MNIPDVEMEVEAEKVGPPEELMAFHLDLECWMRMNTQKKLAADGFRSVYEELKARRIYVSDRERRYLAPKVDEMLGQIKKTEETKAYKQLHKIADNLGARGELKIFTLIALNELNKKLYV